MIILIFDSEISGHHLEYIHHLHDAAVIDTQNQYIFIVNNKFDTVKNKLIWKESNNIRMVSLSNEEQKKCFTKNLLLASWYKSLLIRKYVKAFNANQVWLIMLMQLMPFLPFLIKNKIKITGVLYRIYLYEKEKMTSIRSFLEFIRYKLLIANSSVKNILVLNDKRGTEILNRKYKTNKFRYIPDPVPSINETRLRNIRSDFGITQNDILYLHFGGLNRRKGTLDIMEAIDLLSSEDLKSKVFIFAGKIDDNIKKEFYELKKKNEYKSKIIVFDEFCSYEFINNLCFSCDCILVPYHNTNQSSGVIGYAGYFKKPVIAPSKGLLGYLVREYNLGITLQEMDNQNLSKSILIPLPLINSTYSETHTIQNFINVWYN